MALQMLGCFPEGSLTSMPEDGTWSAFGGLHPRAACLKWLGGARRRKKPRVVFLGRSGGIP